MQDVAHEIVDFLEPSLPIGYRLVILSTNHDYKPVFEAKAVHYKGKTGFMIRKACKGVDPPHLPQNMFAPSETALKFAIRNAHNEIVADKMMILMPPDVKGYDRAMGIQVPLSYGYSYFEVQSVDSFQERVLDELIGALTLMHIPVGLKWDEAGT